MPVPAANELRFDEHYGHTTVAVAMPTVGLPLAMAAAMASTVAQLDASPAATSAKTQ